MAQELVWVEAVRHVAQAIVVLDLERGARYLLPREMAQQLTDAGAVKLAPAQSPTRLEAAVLAAPSRRSASHG